MQTALVLGAGGFIGSHLVKDLKSRGYWVRGADLKSPEFSISEADEFVLGDLTDYDALYHLLHDKNFTEVYQLAADMGGAEYIFSGDNDTNIMTNSVQINLNLIKAILELKQHNTKIFYSSSACIYPEEAQLERDSVNLVESAAYPANPDSEYGWEKLFSERLFLTLYKNYGVDVRIARFHNVYGPESTWRGGKEKAPAAICRKVLEADVYGDIEIFGTGEQSRSFLFIEDALRGVRMLMESNCVEPLNIGSEEDITINGLVDLASNIAGKRLTKRHIDGPTGVDARNSENTLVYKCTGWEPTTSLADGIAETLLWIERQISQETDQQLF